jgi:hypothetical protein
MTIYLYVKTHNKTGLKYLGKTERDPHKYKGSGTYWRRHIKEHGYDVTTEILRECITNEEVYEWGIHYSHLWNVVESDEWANLKEESSDGNTSNDAKKLWEDAEYRAKIDATWTIEKRNAQGNRIRDQKNNPQWEQNRIAAMNTLECKTMLSENTYRLWENAEFRKMMSEKTRKQWEEQEFCDMMSDRIGKWATELWKNPEHRTNVINKISGKNNYRYDHTKYYFIHKTGISEFCTSYELHEKYPEVSKQTLRSVIKGRRKSHKGWRIMS